MRAQTALGLDAPVTFAFLARAVSIAGSTGTVLLIVRFLSPTEQGYYYTLLSLVALQSVFEMGFSFVIQQLAAHESVHLRLFPNGTIEGDPAAHGRLASALKVTVRWYTAAAILMGLILTPLGFVFFAHHSGTDMARVAWRGPWLLAVAASMAGLWSTPLYAFLEGCGEVREVAALRLRQSAVAVALGWPSMLLHRGLYSPALIIIGQVVMGWIFLAARRRLIRELLLHPAHERAIRWRTDVWPFQWRIAVSWVCSYFAAQIFIPILFAARGPVEAGKMGMSLSITGYITVLALSWTSTKATPFGKMIARREFDALDRFFRRSLAQSLAAFAVIALSAVLVAALLPAFAPSLAKRMLSPGLFALLVLGAGANCATQNMGTLLRSFKREPFMFQSVAVALLTLTLAVIAAPRWGSAATALIYLAGTAGIALPSGWLVFARARRKYLAFAGPRMKENSVWAGSPGAPANGIAK
jgi:hypothetical protein